jgi:hypothetical protein|tara:strand:+ start:94 stop:348 length:255 start_codon:yes stop_codon:yes gene_type:complete
MNKYTPLDKKETKAVFIEKIQILFDSMENVIAAHETWLEDASDWTKQDGDGMVRLSRSWLDESLEEGKEAVKNLKRYKILKKTP